MVKCTNCGSEGKYISSNDENKRSIFICSKGCKNPHNTPTDSSNDSGSYSTSRKVFDEIISNNIKDEVKKMGKKRRPKKHNQKRPSIPSIPIKIPTDKNKSNNYDNRDGRNSGGGGRPIYRSKINKFKKINNIFTDSNFTPRFGFGLTQELETRAIDSINDKINPLWDDIKKEFDKSYEQYLTLEMLFYFKFTVKTIKLDVGLPKKIILNFQDTQYRKNPDINERNIGCDFLVDIEDNTGPVQKYDIYLMQVKKIEFEGESNPLPLTKSLEEGSRIDDEEIYESMKNNTLKNSVFDKYNSQAITMLNKTSEMQAFFFFIGKDTRKFITANDILYWRTTWFKDDVEEINQPQKSRSTYFQNYELISKLQKYDFSTFILNILQNNNKKSENTLKEPLNRENKLKVVIDWE